MAVLQQSIVLFKEASKSSLELVPVGTNQELELSILWQRDITTIEPRLFLMVENKAAKAAHCTIDAYLVSRGPVPRKLVAGMKTHKIGAKEKYHLYLGSHAEFQIHCFTKSQLKNESVKRVMADFIFHVEKVKWEK